MTRGLFGKIMKHKTNRQFIAWEDEPEWKRRIIVGAMILSAVFICFMLGTLFTAGSVS